MKSRSREAKLEDLIHTITRRDPSKRQIKPVNTENILFDDVEDESDDEYVYNENDDDVSGESDSSSENEGEASSDSDSDKNGDSDSSIRIIGVSHAPNAVIDDSTSKDVINVPPVAYPVELTKNDVTLAMEKPQISSAFPSGRICMLCLGEQSNLSDELIECDACKIVVHEDCHKVYDDVFLSSSASSSDTDPWFCEPCLAGVENPHCELCPNLGGVFKRTDNNRWVHLLCALYTPGVAFNYSESLSEVTLTELPAKDWSSKECGLCEDKFFAWTGVCINCDAGLCKNYFHVTCAQREGLLAEPAYEENPTDPFFAQCRQHTDKQVARTRRRNYLSAYNRSHLLRQMAEKDKKDAYSMDALEDFTATHNNDSKSKFSLLDDRLKGKLEFFRRLYDIMLSKREVPYTRPNKVPLYLENSPVAMRMFMAKAVALSLPIELTGSSAVTEASKSLPPGCPVFCADFVSYVLEREKKIEEYSKKLTSLESAQRDLQLSDANVSSKYNSLSNRLNELNTKVASGRHKASSLLEYLTKILPGIKASGELATFLAPAEVLEINSSTLTVDSSGGTSVVGSGAGRGSCGTVANIRARTATGPTRQSRKRSRKEPNTASKRAKRSTKDSDVILVSDEPGNPVVEESVPPVENIFHQCSICGGYRDQHLLTICDTCKKAFHIACLDPPLTRVPKQSKLFAWQCSMCTVAVVTPSDAVTVDINAPRQLRRTTISSAPPSTSVTTVPSTSTPSAVVTNTISKTVKVPTSTPSKRSKLRNGTYFRGRGNYRRGRPRRVEAEEYPCRVDVQDMISTEAYLSTEIQDTALISTNASSGVELISVSQQLRKVGYGEEEDIDNGEEGEEGSYSNSGDSSGSNSDESETVDEGATKVNVKAPVSKDKPAVSKNKQNASDDELASLRGSKVKFVRIKDHESPNQSFAEPLPQRYVICQSNEIAPKKSPTSNNIKIKIRKSTDG